MLGYIKRCGELGGQSCCGLFLAILLAPTVTPAQTPMPPATDRTQHVQAKAKKKHSPERTFVLVGAGDIASCKSPEGARATPNLIDQIPRTVFAPGALPFHNGTTEH